MHGYLPTHPLAWSARSSVLWRALIAAAFLFSGCGGSLESERGATATPFGSGATPAANGAWQELFTLKTASVAPHEFQFSVVKDGAPLRFELGDGTVADGNHVKHTYNQAGEKTVRVLSKDGGAGVTMIFALSARLKGPLPREFGELENLSYVNLGGNQLSGPVPAEFGKLSKLMWLSLPLNQISGYEAGAFAGMTMFSRVSLEKNELSQAAVDAMVNDIYQNRRKYLLAIKALNIRGNIAPSATAQNQVKELERRFGWAFRCSDGC